MYIKVKACTPINEIEQVLSENNQELAFEPIDFGYIKEGKSNKGDNSKDTYLAIMQVHEDLKLVV